MESPAAAGAHACTLSTGRRTDAAAITSYADQISSISRKSQILRIYELAWTIGGCQRSEGDMLRVPCRRNLWSLLTPKSLLGNRRSFRARPKIYNLKTDFRGVRAIVIEYAVFDPELVEHRFTAVRFEAKAPILGDKYSLTLSLRTKDSESVLIGGLRGAFRAGRGRRPARERAIAQGIKAAPLPVAEHVSPPIGGRVFRPPRELVVIDDVSSATSLGVARPFQRRLPQHADVVTSNHRTTETCPPTIALLQTAGLDPKALCAGAVWAGAANDRSHRRDSVRDVLSEAGTDGVEDACLRTRDSAVTYLVGNRKTFRCGSRADNVLADPQPN
ncbi:hypothetical protein EVAR_44540_1 [Eumeta japonica]|uniref:Uncharacterized protein n=1 Tax=Eumeta variegata TaxID=151549 RepID=A0A4C1XBR3_EUMVA|nr:hypothetical protein EVAR_44540_1 [Eumeta japonica]